MTPGHQRAETILEELHSLVGRAPPATILKRLRACLPEDIGGVEGFDDRLESYSNLSKMDFAFSSGIVLFEKCSRTLCNF